MQQKYGTLDLVVEDEDTKRIGSKTDRWEPVVNELFKQESPGKQANNENNKQSFSSFSESIWVDFDDLAEDATAFAVFKMQKDFKSQSLGVL